MLLEELKKIWRPGILMAVILFGTVYYWMFLDFNIRFFPNGPYQAGAYEIAVEMKEMYGTSLDEDEFETFAQTLPALQAEADRYIQASSVAETYGLTGYTQFLAFEQESGEIAEYAEGSDDPAQKQYADAHLLRNYLTDAETNNIAGRIQATQGYIRAYEAWRENGADLKASARLSAETEREYKNAQTLFFSEDKAWQNILPWEAAEVTGTYFSHLLVWMALSLCILLSPVLVRDRMRMMRPLQWSSRRGRGVLNRQFAASALSAFILTTLNLLIFGGLFLTNGTMFFADCKLFSFMMTGFTWGVWSYGAWCCALVVICYLVCLGVCGMICFLSNYSGNYITMLMKLIPLYVIVAVVSSKLVYYTFYYSNALYRLTRVPMTELAVTAAVLAGGAALSYIAIKKAGKEDMLTV